MSDVITNDLVSIEAVAADIARELREHPERWTQVDSAHDAFGNWTNSWNENAVTWCLEGHVGRRVTWPLRDQTLHRFKDTLGRIVFTWNDERDRTVGDVIALCERIAGPGYGFAYFHSRSAT